MRPKMMCHIGQQAWCFITGRLHHPTVETRKGWCHERMPGVLISRCCQVFQDNVVAHGLDSDQAKPACKRFILRHRDLFGWHRLSQTCAFHVAIRHNRFFNATVDLLLRAIRGTDKLIEARELQ